MKLLFDENLSRRLVERLSDLFPGCSHVALDMLRSPDSVIWAFARDNDFVLVTADADFYELAITMGPPPKVIWLRGCNYPPPWPNNSSAVNRSGYQISCRISTEQS